MHRLSSSFVLAYHGCDQSVAERLLQNEDFERSTNEYDWLGDGVYFWEANPDRARQWALEQKARDKIKIPYVIGAVVDLGFCLDLTTSNGIQAIESSYKNLKLSIDEANFKLPSNSGGKDRLLRRLDCAVVNYLHTVREEDGEPPFDSVRGLFPEGQEIYPTSGFQSKTHIQICVRNQENIHGVFRVKERYFSEE